MNNGSKLVTLASYSPRRTALFNGQVIAFTIVELLVVVAILAILALVQLPALAKAKCRTLQSQCATNLKKFALVSLIYGNENNDRLPQMTGGDWPWDMSVNVANALLNEGCLRDEMYCPANPLQNADGLWNFAFPNFRTLGYATAFQNTASVSATNLNPTITPRQILIASLTLPAPRASQRVLLADATISIAGQSQTDAASRAFYEYVHIPGGYNAPGWTGHQTAHMSPYSSNPYSPYPAGGNVAMLDGHAEWRPFQNMVPRNSGGNPVFWW